MEVKKIPLKFLVNNEGQVKGIKNNPRHITKEAFEKLKASIVLHEDMLKYRELLVFPHGTQYIVIAGNQRLRAMRELKHKDAYCKVLPADTSYDFINALIVKDNVEMGDWDWELLANEWKVDDLVDWGVELPVDFGVIDDEEVTGLTDEDEIPELPAQPIAKRGDVWLLGKHRVMCGDSTMVDDVDKLMAGAKADMVFTDPPYGIDYSGGRTQVIKNKAYGKIKNDDLTGQELSYLICNVFLFIKNCADVYICCSPILQKPFLDFIESQQKELNSVIVWDKKNAELGYMAYRRQCEFILFIKGAPFKKGDATDFDLWSINRDNASDYVHSTQKPVLVPERAIINSSKKNNIILDLFAGSGSTLIACVKTGRVNYSMELDEKYVDVIIKRWQQFTGEDAILEGTKQTFNELAHKQND